MVRVLRRRGWHPRLSLNRVAGSMEEHALRPLRVRSKRCGPTDDLGVGILIARDQCFDNCSPSGRIERSDRRRRRRSLQCHKNLKPCWRVSLLQRQHPPLARCRPDREQSQEPEQTPRQQPSNDHKEDERDPQQSNRSRHQRPNMPGNSGTRQATRRGLVHEKPRYVEPE